MGNDTVSIVIAIYNRANLLERGLYTIVNQSILPTDLEIVCVDDGSSDDTREVVFQYAKKYHSIRWSYAYLNHPEPRISCRARNVGIKAARGNIIVFTEPEALQVGDTIQQLIEKMKEYPKNTILASQVWTTQPLIAVALDSSFYKHPKKILKHPFAQLTDNANMANTNAPNSDWAITGELNCNAGVLFATRKEWLMEIGGFDESFTGHGYDDFDLFARLQFIGHGVVKTPDIAVIHMYHNKGFYPYNIYETAEKNGKISEANIKAGRYKVNDGNNWGLIND